MNRLFFGLFALMIIFFTPAASADPTQVTEPGDAPPVGSHEDKNEIHPNITNGDININTGLIGPNTVPNNVNKNDTVDITPGEINGNDDGYYP